MQFLCDICQIWVHIKCNHLNYMVYKYLLGCNEPWYYLPYSNTLFPFGNLNNQNFLNFIGNNNTITSSETKFKQFPAFETTTRLSSSF